MIAAGKIVKAFGLTVFPVSLFVNRIPALPRLLFLSPHKRRVFFLAGALVFLGIAGLLLAFFRAPPRSPAENLLLSLSLEDRIAYADGIESLLLEEPSTLTRLVGLDIALLMGRPVFTRRDGSRVVWQYKAPPCVLDLYLDTANPADQDPYSSPIVYYEIRPRNKTPEAISVEPQALPGTDGDSKTERSCLSDILNAARAGRLERLLLSGDSSDI